MTWSKCQRTTFLAACNKAGLNSEQRYMLMRYVGCASDATLNRPTVTGNHTRRQFRECMSLVEAAAAAEGVRVRPPREHDSWHAACHAERHEEEAFARRVAREAAERLPKHFDAGLLDTAVAHVATNNSNPLLPGIKPEHLEQCDGPTTRRVAECLRAWVGRVFHECGMTPHTFEIPKSARRTNKPRLQGSGHLIPDP